jgi:hypothetical protein
MSSKEPDMEPYSELVESSPYSDTPITSAPSQDWFSINV